MRFGEARQVIEAATQPMTPARAHGDPKIAPFRHRNSDTQATQTPGSAPAAPDAPRREGDSA